MEFKWGFLGNYIDSISERGYENLDEVILVNTSDIFNGEVLNNKKVKNENLKGQFKKSFKNGDILFSEIRPANKRFARINFDSKLYIASTKLMVLRNKSDAILTDYIYYFLTSDETLRYLQDQAESRSGTFPQITFNNICELKIRVPEINEQINVVNILKNLDSKIEINNKIISNLESQAQAIFKSWFVDFEPFQDGDFVESELGMIPEGWEVKELGEIINLYDNKRVPISKMDRDKMEKNYPYYGANGIIDYVDNYLFDGKYLLMGEDGTVRTEEGFPILNYVDEKFWVSNHAHIMRGTLVSTEYIYLLLSKMFINNIVTGAVQEKINQRNLKGIKIIFPEKKELERFEKIIEPMFKMKLYLNNQNTKLAELRDALLPKLMAGEIDVSNIKIEGEEAKNE